MHLFIVLFEFKHFFSGAVRQRSSCPGHGESLSLQVLKLDAALSGVVGSSHWHRLVAGRGDFSGLFNLDGSMIP